MFKKLRLKFLLRKKLKMIKGSILNTINNFIIQR